MSKNLPFYLKISDDPQADLDAFIALKKPDKIAILVDENTREYCLPLLNNGFDIIIEIRSGEMHKTLSTCTEIWQKLTNGGFTRNSLLINLGGGVIGDMGGFVAATYKRGMAFCNIPTTLLSQVDASIGGKLGVDFDGLKNHIGLFHRPDAVILHTPFLKSLPPRQFMSGFAEVIKHALIRSEDQWDYLLHHSLEALDWDTLIPRSISIKNDIVNADPKEKGERKILNYGHTLGHAIETYLLTSENPLLHGEAIAWGMLLENEVATRLGMLSYEAKMRIEKFIRSHYKLEHNLPSYENLKNILMQDKKNDIKGLRFSLLQKEGVCTYDVRATEELLKDILK